MRSAFVPCRYIVRGIGEGGAHVRFPTAADLNAAISICREEIKLIGEAIRARDIPLPNCVLPRPLPTLVFECLGPDDGEQGGPTALPQCDEAEEAMQRANGHSWREEPSALPSRQDISWLTAKVREAAKPGRIAVVGKYARRIALNLFWHGRRPIVLKAADRLGGDKTAQALRRPPKGSLLAWICANTEQVDTLGAIVLVGEHDFDDELATLADLGSSPPVIRAKLDSRGAVVAVDAKPATHAGDISWPKISVVTVSFNQARFLEASIRSVLDQNYPNLEYIVIDGGSTDGSVDIINRYRDRCAAVVIEPDRGQSDALNKGFARATGDIMNWLCSDDLLEPGALAHVGRAYRTHGADLIVGGCMRIGETSHDVLYRHHTALPLGRTVDLSALDMLRVMRSWEAANYFFQPEVFFSRRAWLHAGAHIKEHLYYAMDYDLWLRMALAGATVRHIPATIGCSRVHAGQKTQSDGKYLHQMRQLMQEYEELFLGLQAADAMAKSSVH